MLIKDYLYLVSETDERSIREITMLIKMTDDVLRRSILIYSSYNSKDRLYIKASYLVFVLKIDSVKRGL